MRQNKIFMFTLLIMILLVFCIQTTFASLEEPVHLRCGSGTLGSSWYTYAGTIAQFIRPYLPEGSTIDVLPYGMGNAFAYLLHEGKTDISLSSTPAQKWAYYGEQGDKVTDDYPYAMPELRALTGGMDAYYYAVVVPKELEVDTVEDLFLPEIKPLRWKTLPGASMGRIEALWILDYYGLTFDDIVAAGGSVEHTDFGAIISAFRDYKIDVLGLPLNVGHPATTEIATTRDVKFLPFSQDLIDHMVKEYDQHYATLPAGTFQGQDSPVPSWGNTTGFSTTESLSEDVAYLITKAICENIDELKEMVAAFKPFTLERSANPDFSKIPFHPGAEKYYREIGLIK